MQCMFLRIDTESGKIHKVPQGTHVKKKKKKRISDLTSSHLFRSAVRLVGKEVPLVF